MASQGCDGLDFIFIDPVGYHCCVLSVVILLLVLFVVKKPLGGILQAVLNSVVPTYPERKHTSLDLKLENTVCWIKVTLFMIVSQRCFS